MKIEKIGGSSTVIIKIVIIVCVQVLFIGYSIAKRPFKKFWDNLVLVVNEVFFFTFAVWVLCCNEQSDWTQNLTDGFIALLICNTLIVLIIVAL